MNQYKFTELVLSEWKETRNLIQSYARLLSDIKGSFTPHQKNWEEFSLKIYAKGLTTTTIPVVVDGHIETLDLNLNLVEHSLKIFCGASRLSVPLENQSALSFAEETLYILNDLGLDYSYDEKKFPHSTSGDYSKDHTAEYWSVLKQVYFTLLEFRGSIIEETSNINFWPHHFDLAMLWFSGRLIPGEDPADWDRSREQMNFGFSTGDEGISEPYFYITAYPFKDALLKSNLPANAFWHMKGWKGAVLKYTELVGEDNPNELLLELFNRVLSINRGLIDL